jgi:hypothetical protein
VNGLAKSLFENPRVAKECLYIGQILRQYWWNGLNGSMPFVHEFLWISVSWFLIYYNTETLQSSCRNNDNNFTNPLDLVIVHRCSVQYFLLSSNGTSTVCLIFFYIKREKGKDTESWSWHS